MHYKKITIIFIIISISMLCTSDHYKSWEINFHFLNALDSNSISIPLQYELDVITKKIDFADISNDEFTSDGYLNAEISVQGSESCVNEFHKYANLSVMLLYDSLIVFDSIFTWDELEFNDSLISRKTFYVMIPSFI